MRNFILFVCGGALVACATLFFSSQFERADASRVAIRQPNMATVEIQDIIRDFVRNSGGAETLSNQQSAKRRALRELQGTVQSMMAEAEIFPKNSQQFLNLQSQIATMRAQIKYQGESNDRWFDQEEAKLTLEAYTKAVAAVKKIAKERNFDFVFIKQSANLAGTFMNEVSSGIVVRTVIYAKDGVDITDDVKKALK